MPALKGRALSPVRLPTLIKEYLGGRSPPRLAPDSSGQWDGDTVEQRQARPSEGDYIARMHQRIKSLLRSEAPGYQWPRRHSFQARISDLITLGLLEATGRREEPQERGAGQLGTARGFSRRTWVRLTSGSEDREEWADPIGYLALKYPKLRAPGRELATTVTAPPIPRRRRPRRREGIAEPEAAAAIEAAAEHLERRRQVLHMRLLTVSRSATRVEAFQAMEAIATEFLADVRALYRTEQFPAARKGLELLQNCIIIFQRETELPQRRVTALENCRSSTRVLAESITERLQPPVEAPPGILAAVTEVVPFAGPTLAEAPSIDLPERFTVRSLPRLLRHLETLSRLEPLLVEDELDRLAQVVSDWHEAAVDALAEEEDRAAPSVERVAQLEAREQMLDALDDALGSLDLDGAIKILRRV